MSLHAADDTALHFQDFRAAAGPYRHPYRCARGELQGNAQWQRTGEFGEDSGEDCPRASVAVNPLCWRPGTALLQRPDVAAPHSSVLRAVWGLRTPSGAGDDPAG